MLTATALIKSLLTVFTMYENKVLKKPGAGVCVKCAVLQRSQMFFSHFSIFSPYFLYQQRRDIRAWKIYQVMEKNYKLLLLLPHCHHIIIICIYFSFASHVFTDNLFYSYLHGGKTFSSSLILTHSATDISAISQHHFHIDNWRTCAMYEVCHLSFDTNKVNVFHVTTSK